MSGMRVTTRRRLTVLLDYLTNQERRAVKMGNSARGLASMRSTVADVLKTHGGEVRE